MPSRRDEQVIARQLGRRPRRVKNVCRRCRHGYPQVIETVPAGKEDGRWDVIPTVHWLTCPLLVRAIGQLEAAGWVRRFEERLADDPELSEAMARAHRAAAERRISLLSPGDRARLAEESPRQWEALAGTGVAGIRFPGGVKCLHAHYADFVAGGPNPIGRDVHGLLVERGVPPEGTGDCWRFCAVDETGKGS
ncbi:MAG: DUF501 domain-containing protein [Firmicutes bacterium]|nr:DUF501 domain-containing protein [Bacillota bacterium]